jgi:hypothetical protein
MTGGNYQIRVKGHLSQQWSAWFEGLTVSNVEDGEAVLTGFIVDQAALYGVLLKIHNLGLPLLAVNLVATNGSEKIHRATS